MLMALAYIDTNGGNENMSTRLQLSSSIFPQRCQKQSDIHSVSHHITFREAFHFSAVTSLKNRRKAGLQKISRSFYKNNR